MGSGKALFHLWYNIQIGVSLLPLGTYIAQLSRTANILLLDPIIFRLPVVINSDPSP